MNFKSVSKESGPDTAIGFRYGLACFVLLLLTSASFRSHGFLFVAIGEHYGVSATDASWPISAFGLLTFFSGIVAGPLSQRFSLRPILLIGTVCSSFGFVISSWAPNTVFLTFSYGVLGGFGTGTIILMVNVLMTQYFDKYRALAFGVTSAGSTVASFIFPNLMFILVEWLGFPRMMLCVGCLLLLMIPIAFFLSEAPWLEKECASNDEPGGGGGGGGRNLNGIRLQMTILQEPMFYVFLLSNAGFQWGFDAYLTTLVDLAIQRGNDKLLAVNLVTWFAVADLAGRCFLPILCDRGYLGRDTMAFLNYVIAGIYLAIIPFFSYVGMSLVTFALGPFFGLSAIFYQSLVGEHIGTERMKVAFGLIMFFKGAFFFLKPSFIGYFRDVVGSYEGMYLICGALVIIFALPWLPVIVLRKIRQRKQSNTPSSAYCP